MSTAQLIRRGIVRVGATVLVALAFAVAAPPTSQAEFQIGIYGGWGESLNSDVDIVQPNGTNMTLHDVDWDSHSLSFDGGPPYYGIRATYWRGYHSNWGVMLDYTHAKLKPELTQTVTVSGLRDGAAVAGQQPLNQTVSLLEFTDGLNMLTFNLLYRRQGGRWTPYAGLGLGVSFPHVEFRRTNQAFRTFDYQLTGVAAQALAGLEFSISERLALFGEYKISFAQVHDAELEGGGNLDTDVWTNHVLFGVAYKFGHRAPAPYKAPPPYK